MDFGVRDIHDCIDDLFLAFPEHKLYRITSKYAGVIQGDNCDTYYFLGLCVFSVAITALLVFCFVVLLERSRQK
ncbi:hypothetical protein D3C80_1513810 [compost metagenome]